MLNPILVAEVASPSSVVTDHVDKLAFYAAVPSIQAYPLLDQDRVFAACHNRAGQSWHSREYSDKSDVIPLAPLGIDFWLAELYRRVELPS